MFWADQIAKQIIKTGQYKSYWVDDMKTPSGRIHVGSLRGVLIHDFVFKSLKEQGKKATYTYVYNDMDPMDGLPAYLDKKKYLPQMGKPLYKIPAPDGGDKSFAQFYADEFTETMRQIGVRPKILWSHELYESGQMDEVIQEALDDADKIQEVYHKVAGYDKKENWYPFQVNCEQCGKVGTTTVYKWDGEFVYYRCEKDKVEWAQGCGHEGKVSPFGGTGKLPWKVDWPAHWKAIGITIEGAGKDHSSAGGSRDIAKGILKAVYHYPNPFDIPYEWILVRGTKMSSSKGVGTPAKDFVDQLPPEVARFLFARTHYNKVIDFDPEDNAIPDLFDEYDRCASHYYQGKKDSFARMFAVSQIGAFPKKQPFVPRFRDVATLIQDPKVKDLKKHFAGQKGSQLTKQEEAMLTDRVKYAQIWLKDYAPKEEVVTITSQVPPEASSLTPEQKAYLQAVTEMLAEKTWEPEELQQALYEKSKELGLPAKKAFGAIYLSLLGKSYGPKAAWLIKDNLAAAKKRFATTKEA